MFREKSLKLIVALVILIVGGQTLAAQTPKVFSLDANVLRERKPKIKDFDAALANLKQQADKLLKKEFGSVIDKQIVPPSGDKRDYLSQAPYFWRNPNTPDGLPYIRRDGERNPEIKKITDSYNLGRVQQAAETLALAFYFTGKEEYAAKASEILRMWFLDAKTRMKPNLEFAQGVPGVSHGRGIGIIETRDLTSVVDAVGLLAGSKAWTRDDQAGLEKWFDAYSTWLQTSRNGREEAAAKNNHGTFYDVQIVAFALFVGKKDLAKSVLEAAKEKRFAEQIAADGRQPLELERTKSWDYSVMNLEGLTALAALGEQVGVDLWNFQAKDGGGSLRQAFNYLTPYLDGKTKWTGEQIGEFKPEKIYPLVRAASRRYADAKFSALAASIPPLKADEKDFLVY